MSSNHQDHTLTETNICDDLERYLQESEQTHQDDPPPAIALPEVGSFNKDLSRLPCKGALRHWMITERDTEEFCLDPAKLIAKCVRTPGGRTSPISCIDPKTRRVQTINGSVYELGMPDPIYAALGRLVLLRLGC